LGRFCGRQPFRWNTCCHCAFFRARILHIHLNTGNDANITRLLTPEP
jgi:hypothetical protein